MGSLYPHLQDSGNITAGAEGKKEEEFWETLSSGNNTELWHPHICDYTQDLHKMAAHRHFIMERKDSRDPIHTRCSQLRIDGGGRDIFFSGVATERYPGGCR